MAFEYGVAGRKIVMLLPDLRRERDTLSHQRLAQGPAGDGEVCSFGHFLSSIERHDPPHSPVPMTASGH